MTSRRTFTGCWSCRSRKVKCDEKQPTCTPCLKIRRRCGGYRQNLVWVEQDHKTYRPKCRRAIGFNNHGNGLPSFDQCQLDALIEDPSSSYSTSPFTVFRIDRNPSPLVDPDQQLLQYYVGHVSYMMMPFDDQLNPWKSYPKLAIDNLSDGRKYLLHAILAHTALIKANTGQDRDHMLSRSTQHYLIAIEEVQKILKRPKVDYVSFLTTVMTLMFIEIFKGSCGTWRSHLDGAWRYLQLEQYSKIWEESEDAWSATQSFCLIKILSDTTTRSFTRHLPSDWVYVAARPRFGITIGSSRTVMECISIINSVYHDKALMSKEQIDTIAQGLLQRLQGCDQEMLTNNAAAKFHLQAFKTATVIYLYQSLYESSPSSLQGHVREVVQNLTAFSQSGGGNLTLWPVFIAGVEAYEDEDITSIRKCLDIALTVGMDNRIKVKTLLEEIWSVRIGNTRVDWRSSMDNLQIDVLLV